MDDNREVEMEFCDHEVNDVKIKVVGLGYLNINFQRMTGEVANGLGKICCITLWPS